jgi:hypothetical protein
MKFRYPNSWDKGGDSRLVHLLISVLNIWNYNDFSTVHLTQININHTSGGKPQSTATLSRSNGRLTRGIVLFNGNLVWSFGYFSLYMDSKKQSWLFSYMIRTKKRALQKVEGRENCRTWEILLWIQVVDCSGQNVVSNPVLLMLLSVSPDSSRSRAWWSA